MSDDGYDSLYQTTDAYDDPFEIEFDGDAYVISVTDSSSGEPVKAECELTPEQMRDMVMAVGTHVQKNSGA